MPCPALGTHPAAAGSRERVGVLNRRCYRRRRQQQQQQGKESRRTPPIPTASPNISLTKAHLPERCTHPCMPCWVVNQVVCDDDVLAGDVHLQLVGRKTSLQHACRAEGGFEPFAAGSQLPTAGMGACRQRWPHHAGPATAHRLALCTHGSPGAACALSSTDSGVGRLVTWGAGRDGRAAARAELACGHRHIWQRFYTAKPAGFIRRHSAIHAAAKCWAALVYQGGNWPAEGRSMHRQPGHPHS